MAICSWFHGKISLSLQMTAFWKKVCQKQVFCACENGAFFSLLDFFGKMPNFAGLWCPNYLTQGYSWGIIGKIISVAFIWYLVVLCVTDSLVTIASWKSGLILSTLKMLISVLSNKAVLGYSYFSEAQVKIWSCLFQKQLLKSTNLYGSLWFWGFLTWRLRY